MRSNCLLDYATLISFDGQQSPLVIPHDLPSPSLKLLQRKILFSRKECLEHLEGIFVAITPALYIEMAWAMLGFSSLTEIYDPFSRGRKSMKDYSRDERERE